MKLADNLQIQRKKMGFSQEELAEKCQISRQAIAKWESGESVPTIEKLIFLADLYDLTLDEQQMYFATPFFIWANYDIDEATDVLTSTNYLGTMMMEQTGLEMADYNYYLQDLMEEIPALNHLGYMDT